VGRLGAKLDKRGLELTLQFQDYWPASVNASATNNVWVVGWDGKTRTYTTSWGAVQTVTDKDLYDAAVVATNSVFAAGNQRFLTYTGTWSSRTGGTGQTVYGIDGYGATGVWMATAYDATYGNVQVTTDGGRSWTTKTTPDNAKNMQSVSVIDQNNIWICGDRYIYYWNGTAFTQQLSANIIVRGISMASTTRGWAVTNDGRIRYYPGTNWNDSYNTRGDVYGVSAADTTHVWAVGAAGGIWYTSTGGSAFTQQTSVPNTTTTLYGVTAVNSSTAWAAGSGGAIWYTTNSGATWSAQTSGVSVALRSVSAVNASTAWAVGDGGKIVYTTNAGATWTLQTNASTTDLYAVWAYDANNIWASGLSGTMLFADPPYVGAVSPRYTAPGSTVDAVVYGGYTHFDRYSSVVDMGTGVTATPVDNDNNSTTWMATQITVDPGAALGPRDVNVTTGDEVAVTLKGGFVVGTQPTIAEVSPASAAAGSTLDVEVAGSATGFDDTSQALFGAGVTVNSLAANGPNKVVANITVADGAAPGARDVNVVTGQEVPMALAGGFSVLPRPQVTAVSPDLGNAGDMITIDGAGFGDERSYLGGHAVSLVEFGGKPAAACPTWTDNRIVCEVPGNVESGPVTVKTPGGTSNAYKVFDVNYPAPTITSITPDSGTRVTKVSVTDLAGTGFRPGASVRLERSGQADILATDVSVTSPTRITCQLPISGDAATGAWDLTMENTDHKSATLNGAFAVKAAGSGGSTWYLAEGSTAWGFNTDIAIINPNNQQVTVRVTYLTNGGPVHRPDITMAPLSRTTINPVDQDNLLNTDFSTKVECLEGKSIACDRTMFWRGPGAQGAEGHSSIGVTNPATAWYLPEGSSAWGFECWLLLMNPSSTPATCTVTYMVEGTGPVLKQKTVPANSRASFNIADDIGSADASIMVTSDVPVIPERAMYRNNRREGHDSIGVTAPSNDFYLAEGSTAWGYTTYVLIENPNPGPCDVTVSYMTPDGKVTKPAFTLPGLSRKTIKVNDALPGTDLSAMVHGTLPIVAERAMYWDNGTGEACHDSIGTPSAQPTWYLADGRSGYGFERTFETWTLVQNPNDTPVDISVTYLTYNGAANKSFTDTIPANSRRSYNMADKIKDASAGTVVESKTAGKNIIVERSMYWDNRSAGTCTIGSW